MHFQFDHHYVSRSQFRVAMFVANNVVRDSRVLKTAQTIKKLGFDITVYGFDKCTEPKRVERYEFPITMLPNPRMEMKNKGQWPTDGGAPDYDIFTSLAADRMREAIEHRKPHILHTHDMIGMAVGAKLHDMGAVHAGECRWIHDIHEYVSGLTELADSTRNYFSKVEREHLRDPDRLTCVSPSLAACLSAEHGLSDQPPVVLNAPRWSDFDPLYPKNIRAEIGLGSDVPLLVYSGGVKPVRGVDTVVDALAHLPSMHFAIISDSKGAYMDQLWRQAKSLGVAKRLHIKPYVPFMNVTSYLRTATIGIHPIHRYPNAEIALPNKLFEYLHAGVPAIVSDNPTMKAFVAEHQCGDSFPACDPEALAETVDRVLNRLLEDQEWSGRIQALGKESFCWEAQERLLAEIYDELAGITQRATDMAAVTNGSHRILQLPAAAAGQPTTLAKAFRACGNSAHSLCIGEHLFCYQTDIMYQRFSKSPEADERYQGLLNDYDVFHYHTRPLYYTRTFAYPTGSDLLLARAMGKKVFFHLRGSEARVHSVFKQNNAYHYIDENPGGVCSVFTEKQQRDLIALALGVCDGVFVVDPELQTYCPEAMIVPRAIDVDQWKPSYSHPGETLRVVHAPSRRGVKGTDTVREAVEALQAEGYSIELTLIENMPHTDAVAAYRRADVVIDQLRIGWYGVLAVEGMALGKAVVAYIRDDLKHHLPMPFPLAIANPDNVCDVLRDLAERPEHVTALGHRARAYVERTHATGRITDVLSSIYATCTRPVSVTETFRWLDMQHHLAVNAGKAKAKMAGRVKRIVREQLVVKGDFHYFRDLARSAGFRTAVFKGARALWRRMRYQAS